MTLATHVSQVGTLDCGSPVTPLVLRARACLGARGSRHGIGGSTAENTHGAAQALGDGDLEPVDQFRLSRPRAGQQENRQSRPLRRLSHCERAPSGPHLAVESQLPEQHVTVQTLAWKLFARRQDRAGEREIQSGTGLRHVSRRQVCGDPAGREPVARVEDRRANALACLTHRGVG